MLNDKDFLAAITDCSLPAADWMLVDKNQNADWFREASKDNGIRASIPESRITQKDHPMR